MSVKNFKQFLNEDVAPEMGENIEVVKQQIDHYKASVPRLKQLLTLEPEKANEEFGKLAQGNGLLALEWEVLKMEYTIQKAQEAIKENTTKVAEMIKQKEAKLKEMTDKMNGLNK